jgi:epoxyqueuosine reductase
MPDPSNKNPPAPRLADSELSRIAAQLPLLAQSLGFAAIGIAGIDLAADEARLAAWLEAGFHGGMHYMERHGPRRSRPAELIPGTLRVISARMDYWPGDAAPAEQVLADASRGYVSRYALGRDYHKVMRAALQRLATQLAQRIGPFGYRVFVDSGPVLEKPLARDAGLGWIGKHTNLIASDAGSWFFLGEIYTDLPLPPGTPASAHCGSCEACIPACPTGAIVAPGRLDARRCISYLTIELRGPIPEPLRPLLGNRIYGCDDCQLVCPWNKFARAAAHPDFKVRHQLDAALLTELFEWTEAQFEQRMAGSAIRRIGYAQWLRNIAVALGNAAPDPRAAAALQRRAAHPSELVREHVAWALERHGVPRPGFSPAAP